MHTVPKIVTTVFYRKFANLSCKAVVYIISFHIAFQWGSEGYHPHSKKEAEAYQDEVIQPKT